MGIDVAILTPIPIEWEAACKRLEDAQDADDQTLPSKIGRIGKHEVVCVMSGKGQETTASALQRILHDWQPRWVLLVGVAGGFPEQNVGLGDVVVASFVYGFDFGKVVNGRYLLRPELHFKPDWTLRAHAEIVAESSEPTWMNRISRDRPDGKPSSETNARLGYVASGNKVIDDPDYAFFAAVRESLPELHAVEMEAVGAGAAIHLEQSRRRVGFLMIRGISDQPASPSAAAHAGSELRKAWRPYAADAASGFVQEFLSRFPGDRNGLDRIKRLLYMTRLCLLALGWLTGVVACAALAIVCMQAVLGILALAGTDARKLVWIETEPAIEDRFFLRVAGQSISVWVVVWSSLATAMEGAMVWLTQPRMKKVDPGSKSKKRRFARTAIISAFVSSLLISLSFAAVQIHRAIRPSVRPTPPDDVKEFGLLIEGTITPEIFETRTVPERLTMRIGRTVEAAKSYRLVAPMLFDISIQPPVEADYFTNEKENGTWELDARFLRPNGKYRINVRLVPLRIEGALDNGKPLPDAQKLVRIEIDPPPQHQLALKTD